MVYREYSWGYCLEKGYRILIEYDQIIGKVEDAQTLVVFCNNSEYKEFAFDGSDIEFELRLMVQRWQKGLVIGASICNSV